MDDYELKVRSMKRGELVDEVLRLREQVTALEAKGVADAQQNTRLRTELETTRRNSSFWQGECYKRSAEATRMQDVVAEQRAELEQLRPKKPALKRIE